MTAQGSHRTRILLIIAGVLAATPALAHHPMGGEVPGTLMDGLMSGLAHPILGVDHLAALVAVGLIAARGAGLLATPGAWVLGMLAGVGLHMAGIGLLFGEALVAGSVLALGLALFAPGALSRSALLALVGGGRLHARARARRNRSSGRKRRRSSPISRVSRSSRSGSPRASRSSCAASAASWTSRPPFAPRAWRSPSSARASSSPASSAPLERRDDRLPPMRSPRARSCCTSAPRAARTADRTRPRIAPARSSLAPSPTPSPPARRRARRSPCGSRR